MGVRAVRVGAVLLAVAAAMAVEGAAQACSCIAEQAPTERRETARRIAALAVAIVEVEPVSPADVERQIGETYRIVQVLHGAARPTLIRMARSFGRDPRTGERWMGATSCDVFPGQRQRVLLIPVGLAPEAGGPTVPRVISAAPPCAVLPVRDPPAAAAEQVPVFSFGGSCDDVFLGSEGAIELIRNEARKLGRPLGD
jgi:hypothetical protein